MANEINQSGFGNNAFQGISDSNINVTQIIGVSPEFTNMKTQLHDMEQLLALLPEDKEQERNELSARIYKHKELIESFKSDVLKLAESFSRIEINTDRLRRAKEHFDKGKITEARVVFDEAMEEMADETRGLLVKKQEFKEETLPKLKAKADEYLIWAQTTALNYESPTHIEDTKKYFERSIECDTFVENLFAYALFLWRHSKFPKAIDLWQRAREIAREGNDRRSEGCCLGNLGIAYDALGEYQKAIEFQKQRLRISRELSDRLGEGQSLGNLGLSYYWIGEYQKAIKYHEQSLKMAREFGDRLGEGNQLGNLGLVYRALGKYQKAIECHEQWLRIAREFGDRLGEGKTLGNLGNAYFSLGEYHKAIKFHEQSLKIAREFGDRLSEGHSQGSLGNAYYALEQYQKAIGYHQQALVVSREIGDRLGEGQSVGNLGMAYYALGEYQKAIEFQEQKLKIVREIGDRLGEGNGLANLGIVYNSLGKKEKACNYLGQSLAIFEAIGVPQAVWVREWMQEAGCLEEKTENGSQET